jgi:hypothetical protein
MTPVSGHEPFFQQGTSGNSTQKDKILIKYFHETTWIF